VRWSEQVEGSGFLYMGKTLCMHARDGQSLTNEHRVLQRWTPPNTSLAPFSWNLRKISISSPAKRMSSLRSIDASPKPARAG